MKALLTSDNRPAIRVSAFDDYHGDYADTDHVLTLEEARKLRDELSAVIARCEKDETMRSDWDAVCPICGLADDVCACWDEPCDMGAKG